MWDLIVSVPNHCLSFYFVAIFWERADFLAFRFCCFTLCCLNCLCSFPVWCKIIMALFNEEAQLDTHPIFPGSPS